NAPVTVTSSGLLRMNGFGNRIAALTVTGGNVQIGGGSPTSALTIAGTLTMTGGLINSAINGMLVLGGNVTINPSQRSAVISGNLSLGTTALGGPTRTFTVAADSAVPSLDIQAIISGDAGVGLSKNGPGTIRFSSTVSNSYAGSTTVAAGTLQLNM